MGLAFWPPSARCCISFCFGANVCTARPSCRCCSLSWRCGAGRCGSVVHKVRPCPSHAYPRSNAWYWLSVVLCCGWPLAARCRISQTPMCLGGTPSPRLSSLIGQYLLALKRIESWIIWIGVNSVAAGLFAWKGLWLTTLLYLVFIVLSAVGWRTWAKRLQLKTA